MSFSDLVDLAIRLLEKDPAGWTLKSESDCDMLAHAATGIHIRPYGRYGDPVVKPYKLCNIELTWLQRRRVRRATAGWLLKRAQHRLLAAYTEENGVCSACGRAFPDKNDD